ncbi:negative factor Nef/F-Protein/Nef protein [Achromobacter ruhlandii]|nr:negative factor Nef/F-Protein/Nef protein [Achromobacter ruhlandii]
MHGVAPSVCTGGLRRAQLACPGGPPGACRAAAGGIYNGRQQRHGRLAAPEVRGTGAMA